MISISFFKAFSNMPWRTQRKWTVGVMFSLIGILALFFLFKEHDKEKIPELKEHDKDKMPELKEHDKDKMPELKEHEKFKMPELKHPIRPTARVSTSCLSSDTYIKQRNEVSEMLNIAKRELAALSCHLIEISGEHEKNSQAVSAAGGWCKNASYSNSGNHAFDISLAIQLSKLFENKSVASFGDGPGDYKRFLDSTRRLKLYDAYDGAPFGPETSDDVVMFMDLTAPQYGLPVYDWVMSLEVAEHIPAKYESIFVDNIVRHAGSGIVLSWAIPDQGGLSHVNNKPHSYVKLLMSEKGFELDMDSSEVLQEKSTFFWLKRNVFVYRRRKDTPLPANTG